MLKINYRQVRRRGRRLVFEAQDLLDRGEHTIEPRSEDRQERA